MLQPLIQDLLLVRWPISRVTAKPYHLYILWNSLGLGVLAKDTH
jgi:hypothetical protein